MTAATRGRVPVRRGLALAALTLPLVLGLPAPSAPADERPSVADVQAQIEALDQDAADTAEALKGTQQILAQVSQRITATKASIAAAQQRVMSSRNSIDDLARSAYTSGGTGGELLGLLVADSPEQFLHQLATDEDLQQSQQTRLTTSSVASSQLQAQENDLSSDLAIAADASAQSTQQRSLIASQIAAGHALIQQLRDDERARLAALQKAEEDQRIAAARAAQAMLSSTAASGPAKVAIDYALSQVGKPYSLAAQPPVSWDCSKLTAAAWGLAGVALTPYSHDQWDETDRVDVADLQPGDLLFYFQAGAHHVVIYIGNGMAVSASNPSRGVEVITDPFGGWYGARYSGAGRIRLG